MRKRYDPEFPFLIDNAASRRHWPFFHFEPDEFVCKHCGVLKIEHDLVQRLDDLRRLLGRPLTVVSGYRCPVHNEAVGGATNSLHMDGHAVDIAAKTPLDKTSLIHGAGIVALTGVGVYKSFVHLDIGRRRYWTG